MASFTPLENWRLIGTYTFFDLNIVPHGEDLNRSAFLDGATPRHRFSLRSAMDIRGVQLDAFLRRVGPVRREPQIVTGEGIAGYTELDLRGAKVWREYEFEVMLRNLLHKEHVEFGAPDQRGGIERSVYAGVTWRRR
jgi:outer membrane receptor for monomeric catechols